jgi:sigma-B regulation protein RsbU (phosphoserine phosphatase)
MSAPKTSVLIVDDDSSVGAWLQLLVRRMGETLPCNATWVTTGALGMQELEKGSYELVLLDYHLPDTDGLTMLSKIELMPKDRRPAVIILTGGGNEEIAVEAMKRGARDYLIKGALDQATMRRSMSAALDTRRLEGELARRNLELREKNAQMEAELAMAREVQQALLPQQFPLVPRGSTPETSTLRFCHRWIPSSGMAGDFFEVFPVAHTAAGVFVCDVMGHGVCAALVTALMRGLLEEMLPLAAEPGRLVAELNRALKGILERSNTTMFATATYLVIDATRRELRYANAGHPNPLLLRRKAGVAEYLVPEEGPGPALGLLADMEYQTHSLMLTPGDRVVLYTDGLYESERADGEAYGPARLLEAMNARVGEPMGGMIDGALGDMRAFLSIDDKAAFADDICVVGIELAAQTGTSLVVSSS